MPFLRSFGVVLTLGSLLVATGCDDDNASTPAATPAPADITLMARLIGRYSTGTFDNGGAEILAWDADGQRIFSVNAADATVDVINISDPTAPTRDAALDVAGDVEAKLGLPPASLGNANSVAIGNGLLAVAIEADVKQDNGHVAVYRLADLRLLAAYEVGALPDMVTFTPDGTRILVANEGEPNNDYDIDPEGSISVIDISAGPRNGDVDTIDFRGFNAGQPRHVELSVAVRIFGPGASVAQDLEPEYIAVANDGRTAWVSLQENNAIAILDLEEMSVVSIEPLGFKDHSLGRNRLDTNDKDGVANLVTMPVFGMYMPDTIKSFSIGTTSYLITANEGDSRDYDGYSEEARVKGVLLDAGAFPDAATLQLDSGMGRLNITTSLGDWDNDGDFDSLFAFGARSFSILDASAAMVFDSGRLIEEVAAAALGSNSNSNNDENGSGDSRSDNKGPEPESVEIGVIGHQTFAFIGTERDSAIHIYDVSNPARPQFNDFFTGRNFAEADVENNLENAGDLGPESMVFVAAENSPTNKPLLLVGNEVSGTVAIWELRERVD